jgi:aminobenzoyl-glutamate utilization protein B
MNPLEIKALADEEIGRRRLLQGFGAMAAASALGVAGAEAVYGATTGYDQKIGVDPATYKAPTGLARRSPAKDTALAWIDGEQAVLTGLSDRIWEFAELSLREWRSSFMTAELLRRNGFTIEWGTAGLPAAFIATFSRGRSGPVLGFNGESDALPGVSQKAGVPRHDPLVYNYDPYAPTYGNGHGCAHNGLGVASAAAAIATARALERHNVGATLRFYGSSGEEQLVGKAYAVRDGFYDDLSVFLDWHPGPSTVATWAPFSALISATFTFLGAAGHGGAPLGNKSGLEGALVMATMTEYLRQNNVGPAGRLHYAVTNGGGAPNVTPDMCSIWYYVREGSPARAKVLYDKVVTCAQAAASATQTTLSHRLTSAIWNTLGNKVGTELLFENMQTIGPPKYTAEDVEFAVAVQRALGQPEVGLPEDLVPLTPPNPVFLGGPSSDVGDVSWATPRVGFLASMWPPGVPFHNWASTASSATHIAHEGLLTAARYLAATAVDLVLQPDLVTAIREEFNQRRAGTEWRSLLPEDLQPPIYQPPDWFLQRTGQEWPTPGITWPVEQIIAREQLGTTGPPLPPVT